MKKEIILIGGGGHARACIDVIEQTEQYRIAGLVDVPEKLHQKILGYEIFATDNELPKLSQDYQYFFISIGQIKSPLKRMQLFDTLSHLDITVPIIISPYAFVSPHAFIGRGTIVMHHAMVNAGATIGQNCIINTKALVEHDAKINDHCHIATGAIINGAVEVGAGTFIGSGAVCLETIRIGKNNVVGSNEKVAKDLPDKINSI